MTGGSRGRKSDVRPGKPDVGRVGDGGDGIGLVYQGPDGPGILPTGPRDDGISIAERRAGALMARANEPQGARRFILTLAWASGQPIGDIERLRINEGLYLAKLVGKQRG